MSSARQNLSRFVGTTAFLEIALAWEFMRRRENHEQAGSAYTAMPEGHIFASQPQDASLQQGPLRRLFDPKSKVWPEWSRPVSPADAEASILGRERYRSIAQAVIVEASTVSACASIAGGGEIARCKSDGLSGLCGWAVLRGNKSRRAQLMGIDEVSYATIWAGVYEWAYSFCAAQCLQHASSAGPL